MERKISLNDLRAAVDAAYEQYKSEKGGAIDGRVAGADPKKFGVSVTLADGTVVAKGDVDVAAALGEIASVPTHALLLQQNTPDQLLKKVGPCCCKCAKAAQAAELPICPHGVRAVSAIVPQNDPDGKYDIMIENVINMMGSAPVLDDKLYERMADDNAKAKVVDELAAIGFELFDNAEPCVNAYTKLNALTATANQVSALGATVAADGVNPLTKQIAFDGAKAAAVVTTMIVHARGFDRRRWLMSVGLPAQASFAGMVLAVLPGFGAIAAYAPEVDDKGISVRGGQAVAYIANKLGLNVFASARVEVAK